MTPFIIAEVGSNWESLDDCLESIVKAKQSGADAVKFQLYTYHELYGYAVFGQLPGTLNPEWLEVLSDKCLATNIEFMCSAFSPDGYKLVDPFVTRHKVASSEMTHVRILETLNTLGKPVILSTGAQTLADIAMALEYLKDVPVTLLYCEGAYPAKWVDLEVMYSLGQAANRPVGLSDHTTSIIQVPRAAVGWNATVIEKHFKIREMETPDSPHSLLPREFRAMVDAIRGDYEPRIGPTPDELPMLLRHKRRLIATTDIKAGDTFIEGENFGIFRSLVDDSKALSPFLINEVAGKLAKVNLSAGEGIGPGDIS